MNLVRPFLAFSAVLFVACEKKPKDAAKSSNPVRQAQRSADRSLDHRSEHRRPPENESEIGNEIDGIDVSKLEGWEQISSAGRTEVARFIRKAREIEPEWLLLQEAMNDTDDPKLLVVALDRFSGALSEWLPGYLKAKEKLKMSDELRMLEASLTAEVNSKGPNYGAIVAKAIGFFEKFPEDKEVQASRQRLDDATSLVVFWHSICR